MSRFHFGFTLSPAFSASFSSQRFWLSIERRTVTSINRLSNIADALTARLLPHTMKVFIKTVLCRYTGYITDRGDPVKKIRFFSLDDDEIHGISFGKVCSEGRLACMGLMPRFQIFSRFFSINLISILHCACLFPNTFGPTVFFFLLSEVNVSRKYWN